MQVVLVGTCVGLTPRLKGIIDGALEGAPPAIKKQYEVTSGFFRRKVVTRETFFAYWRVNSMYWEDGKIEINLVRGFDRVDDNAFGQRKFADEFHDISVPLTQIFPFSLPQAAGLGASIERNFSPTYGIYTVPDVWWGVQKDVDEVVQKFPHLRG